jgi:hypothetical protein
MAEPKAELKAALEELLAEERRDLDRHPAIDELAAYGAGELAAAEQARVEDHLVACAHCLELLLDRGRLADPRFGGERRFTPDEQAEAWQALRARLAADAAAPPEAPRRGHPPVHPRRRLGRWLGSPGAAWALAASLLVVVAGLSLRAWRLERTVEDLSRPQLNAPVVDLFPASPLRGEEEQGTVVELSGASRFFTLILSPKGAPDFAGYRVEILDAGGGVAWSGKGLEPDRHGSFTLILHRRFLGPGEHRVRLYGLRGETRQLIEEFRLRVVL